MRTPIDTEVYAPAGKKSLAPAIPAVNTGNVVQAVSAIKQIVEMREGQRGSKYEQAVTWRDLADMKVIAQKPSGWGNAVFDSEGKNLALTGLMRDALENEIRNSQAYKRLMARVGSDEDMAGLPEEVVQLLKNDIAEEARKRGAAIRELETIIQNSARSFAMKVSEVTAAVSTAQAGVRQITFASATQLKAQAGQITTVKARLDDFGGSGVTVEQKMTATVDRLNGMSGSYSVKIGAGGKFTGFVLSVDAPVGAVPYSVFLIDADKFAIFTGGGAFSPFGVDGSGVYMNGSVRINTGGQSLATLAANAAVAAVTYIGAFSSAPAGSKNNVYRNTTDGNSYIFNGSSWELYLEKGVTGTNGSRGSLTLYASGSSWSDSTANSAILGVTGSSVKVIGDTVTISNGTDFAATKYWSGTSWIDPGVVINGNLLVNGTVSASTLTTGQISIPTRSADIYVGGDSSAAFPFNLSAFHIDKSSGTGPGFSIINSGPAVAMYVDSSASSGIQITSSATSGIGVQGKGTGANGVGVFGEASQSSGYGGSFNNTSSSKFVALATGSYAVYSASGNGKHYAVDGVGPFTGFHDGLMLKESEYEIGDVVVVKHIIYKKDVNNTLAEVELSSLPLQNTGYGVISEIMPMDNHLEIPYEMWWNYIDTHDQFSVNGVGEGQINVCGENGNINNGDLIVTSSMPGKGMRGEDGTSVNRVIAKATESVSFLSPSEVKMIACVYMCG